MRVQFKDGTLQTAEPYLPRERLISHAVNTGGISLSVGGLLLEGFTGLGSGISGLMIKAVGPDYEDLDALVHLFARFVVHDDPRHGTVPGM